MSDSDMLRCHRVMEMGRAVAIQADGDPARVPDDALVRAAISDPLAFAAIYERFRIPVYRYLRARTESDDDALELAAATFERALRSLATYRASGAGLGAWLFRIARNAHLNEQRRVTRQTPLDAMDRPSITGHHQEGVGVDLQVALARLPAATRDAIALRYAAGLTAREIGAVLGKRPDAVQKLIERGLESLREDLS